MPLSVWLNSLLLRFLAFLFGSCCSQHNKIEGFVQHIKVYRKVMSLLLFHAVIIFNRTIYRHKIQKNSL